MAAQNSIRYKDARHRGDYKSNANPVSAFDEEGNEIGIVFQTASPFDTPRLMEELVAWTKKALDEKSLHPLLVAAVFTVVFLEIHPFQDGNGRLSRILTTLILLRSGYEYERAKAGFAEIAANHRPNQGRFEELLSLSLRFISSPWKLWETGDINLRRTVIKLTFQADQTIAGSKGLEHQICPYLSRR